MKTASAEVFVNLETEDIETILIKANSDLESQIIEQVVVAPLRASQGAVKRQETEIDIAA